MQVCYIWECPIEMPISGRLIQTHRFRLFRNCCFKIFRLIEVKQWILY